MSEEEYFIECSEHGKQQATYVCQHIVQALKDNKPNGFWSSEESPDNLRPELRNKAPAVCSAPMLSRNHTANIA